MQIYPICARHDNYIWAIVKDDKAIIIDPANSEPVIEFLTDKKLTLSAILITHEHGDHTDGVAPLYENSLILKSLLIQGIMSAIVTA